MARAVFGDSILIDVKLLSGCCRENVVVYLIRCHWWAFVGSVSPPLLTGFVLSSVDDRYSFSRL